jgi:hypothetical protein
MSESGLHAIEIAEVDAPDTDPAINADFPLLQKLDLCTAFLGLMIAAIVPLSLLLPPFPVRALAPERPRYIAPGRALIKVTIEGLRPNCSYLAVSASPESPSNIRLYSNCAAVVAFFRQGVPVRLVNHSVASRPLLKERTVIFRTEYIDFDSVTVSFIYEGSNVLAIEMETKNFVSAFATVIMRLIVSTALLPPIASQVAKLTRGEVFTVEQGLGVVLLLTALFEINPFTWLSFFRPSPALTLAFGLLRDAFASYLGFYCLALLSHFTHGPEEPLYATLLIPSLFAAASAALLMLREPHVQDPLVCWPEKVDFPKFHWFFIALLAAFVAHLPRVYRSVTLQKTRRSFYVFGNGFFIAVLAAFWWLSFFFPGLHDFPAAEVFPLAVTALYALAFDFAHVQADAAGLAYEPQVNGDGSDGN